MKMGLQTPTGMVGTNAICNTTICNGFQSITLIRRMRRQRP